MAPPRAEEVHLIHNLYLQSIKQNQVQGELNTHDQLLLAMLLNGENMRRKDAEADGTSGGESLYAFGFISI